MSKSKDGGPAFPQVCRGARDSGDYHYDGMFKREVMATQIATGLAVNWIDGFVRAAAEMDQSIAPDVVPATEELDQMLVRRAVIIADALIAELSKGDAS